MWATGWGWSQLDSLEQVRTERDQRIHRTTVAAAVVPGSGQLINGKAWKAPIVWAGVWWTVSAIQFNADAFRLHRDALIWETDDDPETLNETGYTASELNDRALFYRRQRDISFLALLGVHALSILDANVDAHLLEFDVSDNLKAMLDVQMHPLNGAACGLRLQWDLAKNPYSNRKVRATW